MKRIFNLKVYKAALMAVITVIISSSVYFIDQSSILLRTSVLDFPEHQAFDGTVYPIKKVPNWVKVTSSNWSLVYNEMPSTKFIDMPFYDPAVLKISVDNLVWGDSDDDAVRNAKITYSVPYMGNYLLDGREYAGSHPAVDIKVPSGTPIYSIANGTVIKVSSQSSGFGHHIVIQHNNFPSLDNANAKETIYSTYSHLSDLFVDEGDVVSKGEQIALSGATGTATTPHLHFQIDNADAPWHPYWPFTWQEVQDAGLDFFSAINAGLGKEKAKETTINPMKYVQKYMDGNSGSYISAGDSVDTASVASSYVDDPEDSSAVHSDEEKPLVEEDTLKDIVIPEIREDSVLTINFDVDSKYVVGESYKVRVLFRDQYNEPFADGFGEDVVLKTARSNVKVDGAILGRSFMSSDASYEKSISAVSAGKDRFEIELNGETYSSEWFEVVDLGAADLFSDLSPSHEYFTAVMDLADRGIVAGYPDGSFRPDATVSRVEALKFILEGIKASMRTGNLPFTDVSDDEWYSKYLYTAYDSGVVDGYEDGTFRPSNTVNKAEFYKILFNGMGVDINPNVASVPFSDVSVDDWYAPFVVYAYDIGIIDKDTKILNAAEGMSRAEVAYAIYKVMQLND